MELQSHRQLTDQELEEQFEDTSLKPMLFNHEAHIRLAFIHIKKYGREKAAENLCIQIKRFDQTHGDGLKFNKEVTIKSVNAIAEIIAHYPDLTFTEVIEKESILLLGFMTLLKDED